MDQSNFESAISEKLASARYDEVIEELHQYTQSQKQTSTWVESTLAEAYKEKGDHPNAQIHLMNAIFLDRENSALRNNLELVQQKIDGGMGTSMQHPADWGFRLSTWIRPLESAGIAFIFLNLFLFLRFYQKRSVKRDWALGSLMALFLSISLFGYYGSGISIVRSSTPLLKDPISSAKVIQNIPAGARVRAIGTSGSYVEIERTDSFRGWTKSTNLHFFY